MHSRYPILVGSAVVLFLVLLFAVAAMSDVPNTMNYQGKLTDRDTRAPLPGPHDMTFRIYDVEANGTALWIETDTVEADSAGIVSVILGSDTPIALAFDGPMWLEVEVDGEVLIPRRELTSVPYAFYAGEAGEADQALNADRLGGLDSGAFADSGHVHDDRYYTRPELNTPGTVNDAGNPADWTKLKNVPAGFADGADDVGGVGDGHSLDAADGDPVDVVYVAADGNVGIGTTSPAKQLDIAGDLRLDHNQGISFGDDNTGIYHSGADLYARATDDIHLRPAGDLYVGSGTTNYFVFDNAKQRLGIGTTSPSQALDVVGNARGRWFRRIPAPVSSTGYSYIEFENPGPGPMGIRLQNSHGFMFMAHGADGEDRFGIINGSPYKEVLSIDLETNNIGIWTTSPDTGAVFHVDALGKTSGIMVENARNYGVFAKFGGNYDGAAVFAVNEGAEGSTIRAYAEGTCESALHGKGSLGVDYAVYGQADGATYAGYFDGDVTITNDLDAITRALNVYDEPSASAAWQTVNIGAGPDSPLSDHDILQISAPAAAPDNFQFIECQRGTDIEFRVEGNGDVFAEGTFKPSGADMAEMIAVSYGTSTVEPGDVMVIDPASPRSVAKSASARTTLVAGIYSTKPGFLGAERDWDKPMGPGGEEGGGYTLLEMASEFDEIPMAVVGIVPCKVSAENGSIRPGDLLVTSATPGHAMRDDDPRVGTVLGKALERLDSGTGTIRVLVTLQ